MADIPAGTIMPFAGKTNASPAGWLPCEGQELSVANFKVLFAAIGTLYGGDGVVKFRIPDLRGRVIVGAGHGSSLSNRAPGQEGGEETHVLTPAEMPSHSHVQTIDDPTGARNGKNQSGVGGDGGNDGLETGSTRPAGGGGPHNTMPPFLVLNFLIKT
jgi:microcystin-dependent protein